MKKQLLIPLQTLNVIALIILGVNIFLVLQNQQRLEKNYEQYYQGFTIANELRQNRNELSHFAHSYVLTSDVIWKNKYFAALKRHEQKKAGMNGNEMNLRQRIFALFVTGAEFDTLREIEISSKELIKQEMKALHAMEGLFANESGKFVIKKPPNPAFAQELMFNESYHERQLKTMTSIDGFSKMFEWKTQKTVAAHKSTRNKFLITITVLGTLIIALSLLLLFVLKNKINSQIQKLENSKEEAGKKSEELGQTNKFLEAILNNSPTGIIIADAPDGNISYVNHAACKFAKNTGEKMAGIAIDDYMSSWKLFYPDGRRYQGHDVPLARALRKGQHIHNEELMVELDDGSRKWVSTWAVPICDDGEKITAAIILFYDISPQKAVERALKESEERLDLAMMVSNDGFWDWNLEDNSVLFSIGYFTMAGYEANEFPHSFEQWYKRIHPDDLLKAQLALNRYIEGKTDSYDVEFRFLCKDGRYIWIRARGQIFAWDENGNPLRMIGTHTDISEYKRLSEKLSQSELLKRNILQTIPDIMFLKNPEGVYLACNPPFERFVGDTEHNIIGKTDKDFFNEKISDAFCRQDKKVIEQDRLIISEDRIPAIGNRQGGVFETSKVPLKTDDGKVLGVLAIAHDITERKQKEKELQELSARLQKMAARVPGMLYQYRLCPKGRAYFPYASEAIESLFGVTPEEAEENAANVFTKVNAKDLEQMAARVAASTRNLSPWKQEFRVNRPDGSVHWLLGNSVPEREADGSILWHGFITDISERKEAEQKLIEAQQQAQSANQSKSEFLANMSHEIRTPMNAILGFAGILQNMEDDPKKMHYLKIIETSGQTLLNLINDILDLSKIEAGKMELQYSPTSISALFKELDGMFSQKISDKKLSCEYIISENVPETLLLDQTRIRQILINLLGNSVKFTHNGFITLAANCQPTDSNRQSAINLVLSITDSGIGIPEHQQSEIFNSFSQARGQNHTLYGGTGLGLAITKRIMDLMNGSIHMESQEGVGTTFSLSIPDVEVCISSADMKTKASIDVEAITFAPATILIADDVDHNREFLQIYLSNWNFELHFAENGKQAVEKALAIGPDLVLLDMKMPVMDGYEASQQLKAFHRTRDIPIIAITAFALNQDEERVREHCDGYLRKPVKQTELVEELCKYLPYDKKMPTNTSLVERMKTEELQENTVEHVLTRNSFAFLSQETREDLKRAISCIDVQEMERLLEYMERQDASIAAATRQHLDNFQYDKLLELL